MLIDMVLGFSAIYFLVFGIVMNTENLLSMFVFKVVPILTALAAALALAMKLGYVIQV